MRSKLKMILSTQKGLTLIEIIAALVILSIIVLSFITFFIQSSRTNNHSSTIIDATYVAQAEIEEIINQSNLLTQYQAVKCKQAESNKCYQTVTNGYHLLIEEKIKDEQTHVIVKVYNDNQLEKLEAQMETILPSTVEAGGG